jgi:hypothetical protein
VQLALAFDEALAALDEIGDVRHGEAAGRETRARSGYRFDARRSPPRRSLRRRSPEGRP